MKWQTLASHLFAELHDIQAEGDFLHGQAMFEGASLSVVGSTNHAAIGVDMALKQARFVLDTMVQHPRQAILLLVDSQGQQLRRRDELLGINRAMAHLGCCVDLARKRGHRIIGLIYDQALSGGFLTSGLIADACYALAQAEIRVMRIPAMARVTKISEERLNKLSLDNPVFAPGVQNYVAMGGLHSLWGGDLRACLRDALRHWPSTDQRARDGAVRGGRRLAAAVVQRVLAA